jgi:hypothetical protein
MVAVVVAALGVAPPTPLLPRVCDPPTSTPRLTLFRCGWVPQGGSASCSPTCVHSLCWPTLFPFPMVLHCRSGHLSRHHLRLCQLTVVSSRLQHLWLWWHGPYGWAHEINNRWPTPST